MSVLIISGSPVIGSGNPVDIVLSDTSFVWAASELSNRFLITAADGGVREWNFDFDSWPAIACERAGRNLTRAEWTQYLPSGEPYHITCPQLPPPDSAP